MSLVGIRWPILLAYFIAGQLESEVCGPLVPAEQFGQAGSLEQRCQVVAGFSLWYQQLLAPSGALRVFHAPQLKLFQKSRDHGEPVPACSEAAADGKRLQQAGGGGPPHQHPQQGGQVSQHR